MPSPTDFREQAAQAVALTMCEDEWEDLEEGARDRCRAAVTNILKLDRPLDPDAGLLGSNVGHDLLVLLCRELKRRMETPSVVQKMTSSELELVRKLLTDNSVTLASIRRGDFGETAKRVAEEYPFPTGSPVAPSTETAQ